MMTTAQTTQQRLGALRMTALGAVRAVLPREEFDRQHDLAREAVRVVLDAAPQGAPDPAAHDIDAPALAAEFAERFGLDLDRAKAIVARIVSALSTQAFFEEAAPKAKPRVGDENAAELSRAGDAVGDLSIVRTMRQLSGDPAWGSHLASSASKSTTSTSTTPSTRKIVLAGVPGRNRTEKMIALILAREPSRRWSFDDLWETACRELAAARASGAEIVE